MCRFPTFSVHGAHKRLSSNVQLSSSDLLDSTTPHAISLPAGSGLKRKHAALECLVLLQQSLGFSSSRLLENISVAGSHLSFVTNLVLYFSTTFLDPRQAAAHYNRKIFDEWYSRRASRFQRQFSCESNQDGGPTKIRRQAREILQTEDRGIGEDGLIAIMLA
jgi:hypothetical protein